MSTIIDKKIAVRVTNTTESPYLIKKHTQIAKSSVVTAEQSKHIKPVDMAILSMIPQGDPHLIAYLQELLRMNKPEQQNNTFWFPTPENPRKLEDHTPVVEERADQVGGGGGWRSLCIKRGYSEPTRAEIREGTSTLAESSRVT